MRRVIAVILAARLLVVQAEVVVIMIRSTAGGGTLTTGLLASWHFEEASGNRADSSGSGLTLTDNNTVGTAAGKIGTAILIQAGVAEFLSRVDGATLSIGTPVSFTFDGWVYPTSSSENYNIVTKGTDIAAGNFEYRIYHPTDTSIRLRVSNSTSIAEVTSASGSCPLNTWTHFRATLDFSNSIIELELNNNGTLLQAAMASGGCWDSTAPFNIGNLQGSSGYAGRIDEVHFWKRTLTTTEQTDLYNSGNGVTIP